MTCPRCGIDTADDCDPVYCTWIPKGVGKLQMDLPMCGACAAHLRLWAQEGAVKLEDREPSSRGLDLAPRYTADQILAGLGIDPDLARRSGQYA